MQIYPVLRLFLVSLIGIPLLAACTIAMPFNSTEALDNMPENETVVVALTHVVLKEDGDRETFWNHTEAVVDSLEERPGFLGYSLRLVVLGDEAWTMTVWQDNDALRSFVTSDVHGEAMVNGIVAVENASFYNFESKVHNIPPSWEEAEALIAKHGRSYSY